ncbi:MAG: preprotein translocase subunit SecG, partial [Candidatus Syntrophonatronum acetioxidans]
LGGKKKGKDELLGKATIYLAAIFMVFSIIITIFHA